MPIRHAFTSPKSDGADSTLLQPSNWNADHTFSPLVTATVHETSDTTLSSTVGIVDVDARLAVTFTAPDSGIVIVTIAGWMAIVNGYTPFHVIREGSTIINGAAASSGYGHPFVPFYNGGNQSGYQRAAWLFAVSPGSHTFKWSHYTDGGGASQVKAGPSFGDAIIKVMGL